MRRKDLWGDGSARRAEDLLVSRLTEGLDDSATEELDHLLQGLPELDAESLELAAAAVDLACWHGLEPESEPMPVELRKRVIVSLGG